MSVLWHPVIGLKENQTLFTLIIFFCSFHSDLFGQKDSTKFQLSQITEKYVPVPDTAYKNKNLNYKYVFQKGIDKLLEIPIETKGQKYFLPDSIDLKTRVIWDSILGHERVLFLKIYICDSALFVLNKIYLIQNKKVISKNHLSITSRIDSLKSKLDEIDRPQFSFNGEIQTGNDVYDSSNFPNATYSQFSQAKVTLLGLPINLSHLYSNQRTPNSLNWQSVTLQVDIDRLIKRNHLKQEILDNQEFLDNERHLNAFDDSKHLDSLKLQLEERLQSPAYKRDFEMSLKELERISQIDSSKQDEFYKSRVLELNNKRNKWRNDSIELSRYTSLIEDQRRLANKYQLKGRIAELLEPQKRNSNLINKYSIQQLKIKPSVIQIGKVIPFWSEISLNSLTIFGSNLKLESKSNAIQFSLGGLNFYPFRPGQINGNFLGIRPERKFLNGKVFLNGFILKMNNVEQPNSNYIGYGAGIDQKISRKLTIYGEFFFIESDSTKSFKTISKNENKSEKE